MSERQTAKRRGLALLPIALTVCAGIVAWAQYPAGPQVTKDGTTVLLRDYVRLPLSSKTTGTYPPPIDFAGQLGRANFLRSEPQGAPQSSSRFFVNDLNRNLYILDKATKTFTTYINFEEVFAKFDNDPGLAGGFITFAFDWNYASNGRFYTVHAEDPAKSGSAIPTNANLPGLDLSAGYTTTTVVNPPAGSVVRQSVLVEWTDTNQNNSTFEGTARELLRVGFNGNIHPMGDLLFNPLALAGDADSGNLYISVGDGASGETAGATQTIPQRLDALQGKILRITPDLNLRPADELSPNGRYRIPTTGPDPNPFVSLSLTGLRKEIYAYGMRNPHRMSWDVVSNKLIVDNIGLHTWEEVNILAKGANYGYSEREGTEQLLVGGVNNGKTGSQTTPATPFPNPDTLTVSGIATPVTPIYPVAQYSHRDGDAISSGFVYRGSLVPQLYAKYVFGDISTGRLFYADLAEMIASDDGNRTSLATVHELQIVFDSPHDTPDHGPVNRRMFDIVADEYTSRGGNSLGTLPGSAPVTSGSDPDGIPYGGGRADIRLALGGDGEMYLLSKSDGMIRLVLAVGAATLPPPGGLTASAGNAQVTLSWTAVSGATSYNVKRSTTSGGPYSAIATGVTTTGHTDTLLTNGTPYFYVVSAVGAAGESADSSQVTATPNKPTVTITATDSTATEAGVTTATFGVSRSGSTAAALVVSYAVTGSATPGSDYAALTGSVTIPIAAGSATITVTPINDTEVEPNETVVVTINADAAYLVGTPGNASATIVSDDGGTSIPGLVAAYGFDDGVGTSAADASGNGNLGTISGPVWTTAGKFGGALSFDGVNDWVTVADSNSLDLTSGMTLEAWVYPTALSGWRTALMKEVSGGMAYALYADASSRPNVYLRTGGDVGLSGTAALPLNAWTHMAATYDGTTMRLYVNGAQAATRTTSGNITTSSSPLHIGGNTPWGEYFAGRLDEIRVYNRALTALEVQTDMNTAVNNGPPPPDTTLPTAAITSPGPGGFVKSPVTVTASASDNIGVAGVQFKVNGAAYLTEDTTAPYSVSWTPAADGVYSLTAVARDAANNSAESAAISVTVDNAAPSVTITAPPPGGVTGSVPVSASASDSGGVVSVQFKLDNVNLGAADTTFPYGLTWDTATASNGPHQLIAVATDTAGNQGQSAVVNVTVSNAAPPPPSGLVAAYGFNEGLGTSVADASGKGNVGTLSGATWTTAGKFGQALSFAGSQTVTVADSNTLDLTTGMTLEAWVKPTALTGWSTVLMKERPGGLAYTLYLDTTHANVYVNVNGELGVSSTTALAVNVWTHVAVTYDGSTMRVFINGAQAASRARSGSLLVSTGGLKIGGNAVWAGEFFRGVIDEVRVYNRALTATEILADMAAAIQ